ncbi:MAG: choice-of-anchor B family protein [Bacteroidota bacterium]
MLKKHLLFLIALFITHHTFCQLNMQFRSQLQYGASNELANIGGYVDSTGKEYALVGCQTGLSIVDVSNPAAPFQKILIPGTNSFWREVKVWGRYAYVTTEGGSNGLQIINLGKLPGIITTSDYKYWKGSGAIANQILRLHSLHIDNGYAYLNGVNGGGGLFGGACIIVSLSDPWNPVYTGNTQLAFSGTQRYTHDCFVRNDTLWGAHIYAGFFSIINVSNKSNPSLIGAGTVTTPGAFTHNTWLNTAGVRTLFATDEISNSYLTSYNVSNISNITELDRIQLTPGSGSIVHNTHIKNNYAIVSWYKDGVAIVDVSRPDNMIITGYYDTYSQGIGNGFNGCWGVYPFLPSGNIVASDINNGLFVLTPTYVRGCYLEGTITDNCTGNGVPNVLITISSVNISKQSKLTGIYKTGTAIPGNYTVTFSKTGYVTKSTTNVSLSNGNLTSLNVQLQQVNSVTINSSTVQPANCFGNSTGSIDIKIVGGTAPYQYIWSNGAVTEDLNATVAGTYTVTVTDAAGCSANSQYIISQPSAIQVNFSETIPSCTGKNDGGIIANVNGGNPGYSVVWNPLKSNSVSKTRENIFLKSNPVYQLNNITSGIYNIYITDASGCTASAVDTLDDSPVPCDVTLHVHLFNQGFYRSYLHMQSLNDSIQPMWCDTFIVSLAADTTGYPIIYTDISVADTSGRAVFHFPVAALGQSFYVVVRHRNSIETWSALPVPLSSGICQFDFTSAVSQNPLQLRVSKILKENNRVKMPHLPIDN